MYLDDDIKVIKQWRISPYPTVTKAKKNPKENLISRRLDSFLHQQRTKQKKKIENEVREIRKQVTFRH